MDASIYPPWQALLDSRDALGLPDLTVQSLSDFMAAALDPIQNPGILPPAQWPQVVEQAIVVFSKLYPHLPFKENLGDKYGPRPDPVGMLKQLLDEVSRNPPPMDEVEFHTRMVEAFASVHDLHTAYVRPPFFRGAVAFLPFRVGYYEDTEFPHAPHFVVTSVMGGIDNPDFVQGVKLVAPDGNTSFQSILDQAVGLTPGANGPANLHRGIMALTIRPMATYGTRKWVPPFDSDTETFAFVAPASPETKFVTVRWGVAKSKSLVVDLPSETGGTKGNTSTQYRSSMGSPDWSYSYLASQMFYRRSFAAPLPSAENVSFFPEIFRFQWTFGPAAQDQFDPANFRVDLGFNKRFGYVAIKSFNRSASEDVSVDLPNEFERILRLIQPNAPDGLIIDIRGNTGGDIITAELMLQMLTPVRITPANFHMANSPEVRDMLARTNVTGDLQVFQDDVRSNNISTGSLTPPNPLTPPARLPFQVYQGPVTLLVDAVTYSAADIFAGGFADHGIGPIVSSDPVTGGGGAHAWSHADMVNNLPADSGLGLAPLPHPGPAMSFAFLRSSRVNANNLQAIEDLGVGVTVSKPRAQSDFLQSLGPGPISKTILDACKAMAAMQPYRVEASNPLQMDTNIQVTLGAVGLETARFFLDHDPDPVVVVPVSELTPTLGEQHAGTPIRTEVISVPFHPDGTPPGMIRVKGFVGETLKTSTRILLTQKLDRRRR